MCTSLPGIFAARIQCVQRLNLQRYVLCIGANCTLHLVDVLTMRVAKSYRTDSVKYSGHLYVAGLNVLWVLDERGKLFCVRMDREEDVKKGKKEEKVEIPVLVFPKECEGAAKMIGVSEESFIVIFKNAVYLVENHKPDQRVKGRAIEIKGLEGNVILANIVDSTAIFLSNRCKLYFISLNDLSNPSLYLLDPEKTITLRGYKGEVLDHIVEFIEQDTLLAIPKETQSFYTWKLTATDNSIEAVINEPWKSLNSNQLRVNSLNPRVSQIALNVFEEDEAVTSNIVFSHIELKSPLYVVATSKGCVYLFHILMVNPAVNFPVLKIELAKKLPINRLYIKWEKLLAASTDGLLSVIDISPKKLHSAYSEFFSKSSTTFSDSIHVFAYRNAVVTTGAISHGVAQFLEVRSLSRLEPLFACKSRICSSVVCEQSVGVVSGNNNIFILSLSKLKVIYVYRGLDSKPVGLYLNERTNSLAIATKNCTSYIYDLATCTLERKNEAETTYKMLGLEEKVDAMLLKGEFGHEEVFEMCGEKGGLRKGCRKTEDFRYFMQFVQTDWIDPTANKKAACNILHSEFLGAAEVTKEDQIRIFNSVVNFKSKAKGKHEASPEIGFSSIRIKLGKAKHNKIFKDENKCNVIVIDLQNLLSSLQKNYIAKYQRTSRKRLKFDDSLSPSEPYKSKSNIFWPLPLLSLVYCFGVSKSTDADLEDELCVCPPILQLWPGVPGVENSFSFAVPNPDSAPPSHQWRISSHLNTVYSTMIFSSLSAIINFNEELVSSLLNRLAGTLPQLVGRKTFPYISLMKASEFLASSDPDIWGTSRDIVLKPFLLEAPPEVFSRLNTQIFNFIEVLYTKVKRCANYKKASKLIKDKKSLVRFKTFGIINTLFGPVELNVLTALCYIADVRKDVPPNVARHCTKLICFLVS